MKIYNLLLCLSITSQTADASKTKITKSYIPQWYLNDKNFALVSKEEKKSLEKLFAQAHALIEAQDLRDKLMRYKIPAFKQSLKKK